MAGHNTEGFPCPVVPKQTGLNSNGLAGKCTRVFHQLYFIFSPACQHEGVALITQYLGVRKQVYTEFFNWLQQLEWFITISQHFFLGVFWTSSLVCFTYAFAYSNVCIRFNVLSQFVQLVLNFSTQWSTVRSLGMQMCCASTFVDITSVVLSLTLGPSVP